MASDERAAPAGPGLPVVVVCAAAPHRTRQLALVLPAGATLRDALRASVLADGLDEATPDGLAAGIWGRVCGLDTPLQANDRVELYRPLQVDPKQARRLRYRRDGLKNKPAPRR